MSVDVNSPIQFPFKRFTENHKLFKQENLSLARLASFGVRYSQRILEKKNSAGRGKKGCGPCPKIEKITKITTIEKITKIEKIPKMEKITKLPSRALALRQSESTGKYSKRQAQSRYGDDFTFINSF